MKKLNRDSLIVANVIVSESELLSYNPEFFKGITPDKFKKALYELGIDTSLPVLQQSNIKHRNRLNEIVKCNRWVGEERLDPEWITSGYASQAAKDKSSGNRLLEDLYRSKSLTKDAQAALEDRDRHSVVDETVWEN